LAVYAGKFLEEVFLFFVEDEDDDEGGAGFNDVGVQLG
jgi:hypothetical protein